jgi:hypothetical protein
MALKHLVVAIGMVAAASPLSASRYDRGLGVPAPAGTPTTRYCMYVEAATGTRIETVECWTRAEWAENGVDVDQDWPKEGVSVVG